MAALPSLDLLPLSKTPVQIFRLWCLPVPRPTVDRFVAEGLISSDEIDWLRSNVFRRMGVLTIGTAILLAGGWTTLLRLGGVKGVWTKRRDWPVMLFGNQIALTLGGLGGYGIGKLWCAQVLEARMRHTTSQNLLVYKYAHSSLPATLPPVGSPLFDTRGQARFSFAGQDNLPLPSSPESALEGQRSALVRIFKESWQELDPSKHRPPSHASPLGDGLVHEEEEGGSDMSFLQRARTYPARLREGYRSLNDQTTADPLGQLRDDVARP